MPEKQWTDFLEPKKQPEKHWTDFLNLGNESIPEKVGGLFLKGVEGYKKFIGEPIPAEEIKKAPIYGQVGMVVNNLLTNIARMPADMIDQVNQLQTMKPEEAIPIVTGLLNYGFEQASNLVQGTGLPVYSKEMIAQARKNVAEHPEGPILTAFMLKGALAGIPKTSPTEGLVPRTEPGTIPISEPKPTPITEVAPPPVAEQVKPEVAPTPQPEVMPAVGQPPAGEPMPKSIADIKADMDAGVDVGLKKFTQLRKWQEKNPGTTEPPAIPPESPPIAEMPTGEKPSRLAVNTEQRAIAKGIQADFGNLPTYETMNMEAQTKQANDLIRANPESAKRIALGDELPIGDLRAGSVYKALELTALKNNDVNIILDLSKSKLATNYSVMGQEIKALDVGDPTSPVKAIRDITQTRQQMAQNRIKGIKIEGVQQGIADQIRTEIRKVSPNGQTWAQFIESIRC